MNWNLRYASAKKPIDLRWGVIHEPLPESVYGNVASVMRDSNFYPDPDALKQALAKKEGLPKEMIEVTAGADFALLMLGIMYGKDTLTLKSLVIKLLSMMRLMVLIIQSILKKLLVLV